MGHEQNKNECLYGRFNDHIMFKIWQKCKSVEDCSRDIQRCAEIINANNLLIDASDIRSLLLHDGMFSTFEVSINEKQENRIEILAEQMKAKMKNYGIINALLINIFTTNDCDFKMAELNAMQMLLDFPRDYDIIWGISTENRCTEPILRATVLVMHESQFKENKSPKVQINKFPNYQLPHLNLLFDISDVKIDSNYKDYLELHEIDKQQLDKAQKRVNKIMNKFGFKIKDIIVQIGHSVNLLEIVLQVAIKNTEIRHLKGTIYSKLRDLDIRIFEPMPRQNTIGIEIPRILSYDIPIQKLLFSKAFQESKAILPISLGSTVNNDVFIADLSIMPNILIGGYRLGRERQSTACLKNIITSLLYKKLPAELKFVLIDSLDSELSVYADIEKYYIAKTPGIDNPIITGTDNAIKTLNCLVQEMGNRYKILEELNVRKISDYNEKWNLELQNFCDAQGSKKYKSMPNIVCVINNYGDLMMAAKKEIEILIVRLARRAQAVGIHMVIATQHFLCDVVTQSIKANFPARIAFHVYEQKESLLIIDRPDAKRLNFWSEMLFSFNGETTRLECSRVRDDVIACICTFIKKQEDKDCDFKPYILPEYAK